MVVHDLYIRRTILQPPEADSILIVDSNATLAFPVPRKSLQSVAGWNPEFLQKLYGIELIELTPRNRPQLPWAGLTRLLGILPVKDIFGPDIREGSNHNNMVARISCYVKGLFSGLSNYAVKLRRGLARPWP
jgi:hypothetical protein